MNKYYTAFDFGNKRVGFAPASPGTDDLCQADLSLDLSYRTDALDEEHGDVTAVPTVSPTPKIQIPDFDSNTDRVPMNAAIHSNKGPSGHKVHSALSGIVILVGLALIGKFVHRKRKELSFQSSIFHAESTMEEDEEGGFKDVRLDSDDEEEDDDDVFILDADTLHRMN